MYINYYFHSVCWYFLLCYFLYIITHSAHLLYTTQHILIFSYVYTIYQLYLN